MPHNQLATEEFQEQVKGHILHSLKLIQLISLYPSISTLRAQQHLANEGQMASHYSIEEGGRINCKLGGSDCY